MKKTYMQPAAEVMNMNASAMMATSKIDIDSSAENAVNTSIDNGINQLGREEVGFGSSWDTEW